MALIALHEISSVCESELGGVGHACEVETSYMLYKHGDLVDMYKAHKQILPVFDDKFQYSFVTLDTRLQRDFAYVPATTEEWGRASRPHGVKGDATLATKEKGEIICKAMANNLALFIDRMRDRDVNVRQTCRPL